LDYGRLRRTGAWDRIYRQIQEDITDLGVQEEALTRAGMRDSLQKHYYRRVFMLSKLAIIPQPKWKQLTERYIGTILDYPWSGEMFSERIWANRDALVRNVKRELV
jgi:hypothetical protein